MQTEVAAAQFALQTVCPENAGVSISFPSFNVHYARPCPSLQEHMDDPSWVILHYLKAPQVYFCILISGVFYTC